VDNCTPSSIDRHVGELLLKLGSSGAPQYVLVAPESYGSVDECLDAVSEKIRRDGGNIVFGWCIWKTPMITEAEFHAVWKSPSGDLIDVTPKEPPEQRILFVTHDRNLWLDVANVDNVRINNTGSPLVDDFILVNEAIFAIANKGDRSQHLKKFLSRKEASLLENLRMAKVSLQFFYEEGGHPGSACYCGSGKKYYECHSKNLLSLLSHLGEIGVILRRTND